MPEPDPRRTGGICAALLAVSYVIASVSYLLLPAEQKGGTLLHSPERYLASLAEGSTLLVVNHLAFGVGALLGIGVVLAVHEWLRSEGSGWMTWIGALGILGFAVTAIDNFQIAALDPMRAEAFARGDAATRTVIVVTNPIISIDPQMWLSFGLTGVWILAVSLVALRRRRMPVLHAVLGVVSAASYLFVEVGSVIDSRFLLLFAAGVGGTVVGPIWYAWLGRALWRDGHAARA